LNLDQEDWGDDIQSPAKVNSLASLRLLYAVFDEYLHFGQTPLTIRVPHFGHFLLDSFVPFGLIIFFGIFHQPSWI